MSHATRIQEANVEASDTHTHTPGAARRYRKPRAGRVRYKKGVAPIPKLLPPAAAHSRLFSVAGLATLANFPCQTRRWRRGTSSS